MDLFFSDRRAIDLAFLHGKPYRSEIFLAKGLFVEPSFRILVAGREGPQYGGWPSAPSAALRRRAGRSKEDKSMDLGFIGLGQMGSAIALNLVKAGHRLVVWNRSAEKVEPLVRAGSRRAANPAECADGEIVVTMLADDRAVERVVFGEDGLLAARKPALHVSMSTISVALAERLVIAHGEAGGSYVSAPVFGRPVAARDAKLFIVAAGPSDALDICEPAFSAISQRTVRVGDAPPAANLIKLCGNFMIMSAIEALAEAMTLAAKGGVEKKTLLDVLTSTLFTAPVYQT